MSTSNFSCHQYSYVDGDNVVKFLKSCGYVSQIIGSLSKGKSSDHDIDILILSPLYAEDKSFIRNKENLVYHLKPSSWVNTDRGGLFLFHTKFGDVDIFFKRPHQIEGGCKCGGNEFDDSNTCVYCGLSS